jgi:hypothetical protein
MTEKLKNSSRWGFELFSLSHPLPLSPSTENETALGRCGVGRMTEKLK